MSNIKELLRQYLGVLGKLESLLQQEEQEIEQLDYGTSTKVKIYV
jgi:flagellar biosynthesis/type III secretory pathway chaperone